MDPRHVLALATNPDSRIIESGDHLLVAVLESLRRLEGKLHGHTPAVRDYWDKVPDAALYRPKEENDFSDLVKRHLQDDLIARRIIVNREVEIRRPTSRGIGERTDIHIDATASGPGGSTTRRITVVVECKGNWNRDLETAMRSQLRDRYLNDASCRDGLYLVAWFNSPKWDREDSRKPPQMTIDEARSWFSQRAQDLSASGFHVETFVMDVALR